MTPPKEDSILPEALTTEVPSIAPQAKQFPSGAEHQLFTSFISRSALRGNNRTTPIQPVEPVVGLTPEERSRQEEGLDLTLNELLGLIPHEEHITKPLQTLDGL